jgi:hypothetical protein
LAALKRAAALRRLSLINVPDTFDLPHLKDLPQVTSLRLISSAYEGVPLVMSHWSTTPLAALPNCRSLELGGAWKLGDDDVDEWTCPLALPPNLTSLHISGMVTTEGALWRHIAACSALEELELPAAEESPLTHPSWALKQLAGSLGRLKRLTIPHETLKYGDLRSRLKVLLRKLYMPDNVQDPDADQQEVAAALRLAVTATLPVTGMDLSAADQHIMPLPHNIAGFSSLEVLELPGGIRNGWWLMCSVPQHWEALAGCTALQKLQGLHTRQPPPAGVKFPNVTSLEVVVAPGDAVGVLGAFPALQDLSISSVLWASPAQVCI